MSRKRRSTDTKRVEVGILNLKLHSNAPAKYERLFQLLSKVPHVQVRGSEFGTIGYVSKSRKNFFTGELYLFLNIDPTSQWYDAQKREPVDPDALGMETQIFDRLKPHLKQKAYAFDLRNHRFFYDSKNFHPKAARHLLERLCTEAGVLHELGEVDVEIRSSKETINEILELPDLTFLEIFVTIPNPDDLSAAALELYRELRAENVRSQRETKRSGRNHPLQPNERTTNLAELSGDEGSLKAIRILDGQPISISTADHPEIISEPYLVMTERPIDALLRVADRIYGKIAGH